MSSYEEMPLPQKGDDDFPAWLVPARNNIQRQLLRLQALIGPPPKEPDKPQIADRDLEMLGWLLGIGFSLWRAVFQAGKALDRDVNYFHARKFLDEIIRNNAAVYLTELNSWSLGYYLNNARFRLVEARRFLLDDEGAGELDTLMGKIRQALEGPQGQASDEWMICFHALRLMLDVMERRLR